MSRAVRCRRASSRRITSLGTSMRDTAPRPTGAPPSSTGRRARSTTAPTTRRSSSTCPRRTGLETGSSELGGDSMTVGLHVYPVIRSRLDGRSGSLDRRDRSSERKSSCVSCLVSSWPISPRVLAFTQGKSCVCVHDRRITCASAQTEHLHGSTRVSSRLPGPAVVCGCTTRPSASAPQLGHCHRARRRAA